MVLFWFVIWPVLSNIRGTWMRVRAFLRPLDQKAAKHREAVEDRAEKHNVKQAQIMNNPAGG